MVNWRPSTLSDNTKPKHNEARFWRSSDCKRRRKDYEIAEPWQTRDQITFSLVSQSLTAFEVPHVFLVYVSQSA